VDPAQFTHKHSKLLDVELVAKRYKEIDTVRNLLLIPAELAGLVERAELRMLEQEKRHSLEIEKLNNEMKKLKNQAVSLENSKEIDLS
jgi:CCR4-NOT transcriptional regulation complex NOT5 subunit